MINVLIATSKPWVANLYASHISSIDKFKVIGTADSVDSVNNIYKNNAIDLIILDVSYNLRFMKNLKNKKIDVDVIPFTYFRDMKNLSLYLKFGMTDYLIKPFESKEFIRILENYLKKSGNIKNKGKEIVIKDSLVFALSLNKRTLDRINEFMRINRRFMTSSEIGEQLKLSITTVRKYLKYLHTIEKISKKVQQKTSKRPLYYYRYMSE